MKGQIVNSEIFVALSYAVGTDSDLIIALLKEQFKEYNYQAINIRLSNDILLPMLSEEDKKNAYIKANKLMDAGNKLRSKMQDGSILICAAVNEIIKLRKEHKTDDSKDLPQLQNTAFIISSIKNPEEVVKLREIYPNNLYLFAINENEESRKKNLNRRNIGDDDAKKLIDRDSNEMEDFGQHTRDVFEMADFHLTFNNRTNDPAFDKQKSMKLQIRRILDLIFGSPFVTPTFEEYAMFVAYSSGLRSSDLGRQVGAVIANENNEIVSTGTNEVPRYGGGQYWPDSVTYEDEDNGRDYKRGYDANKKEHLRLIDEITDMFQYSSNQKKIDVRNTLKSSNIKYLTEFGRAVHVEMSAMLSCLRNGVSLKNATLYCSTFPCHNCAKHIIYSGIRRVVFIEPYPKSKTLELYDDSVSMTPCEKKIHFEEFVGIGPRKFFDLFSLKLSSGSTIIRKDKETGIIVKWERSGARLRFQFRPSYIEKEMIECLKWITKDEEDHNYEPNMSD